MPIDEREGSWRYANGAHAADDDAVVITRHHFFDFAIKTGETVLQEGRARQHGRPLSAGVPGSALEAIPSGKPVREGALLVAQKVHPEIGVPLKHTP